MEKQKYLIEKSCTEEYCTVRHLLVEFEAENDEKAIEFFEKERNKQPQESAYAGEYSRRLLKVLASRK